MIQAAYGVPFAFIVAALKASGSLAFVSYVSGVILIGVGITISLRTLILFPAIAVDSPGAGWKNAYQGSKGRVGLMFLIVITVAIPMIVVGWSLELLLWWAIGSSTAGQIHSILVQSVLSVLSIAAYAAVASRLYLAFGERLGRPAGLASPA